MEAAPELVFQPIDSKDDGIQSPNDINDEPSVSDGHFTEPGLPVDEASTADADDENGDITPTTDGAIPDGDSNADLHALLAYSKSRLEKQVEVAAPPIPDDGEDEATDDDEMVHHDDEVEQDNHSDSFVNSNNETITAADYEDEHPDIKMGNSEEEQLELAKLKLREAQERAAAEDAELEQMQITHEKLRLAKSSAVSDGDRANTFTSDQIQSTIDSEAAHLLKLAEQKVKDAQEKAKRDEEETESNVIKPEVSTTKRSDANSELWALLNYSKMRLETGATPSLGKKASSTKDDMSVSSKRSLSSKKSMSSKASKRSIASRSVASGSKAPVAMVGGPGVVGEDNEGEDVPFPDVTSGNASVDGSVGNTASVDDENESLRDESDEEGDDNDEEEEESSSEEEDGDDELPSFLQDNDEEEIDPVEAKRLYEDAKFKAASILSVSEEKLTEVQMLQAIAIAEEAARKGDEKFSTKRSLFKLNEAKLEDLKAFLDFGGSKYEEQTDNPNGKAASEVKENVGWGIGRGRLVKKLGAVFQDFKEKCDDIDSRKQDQRKGQPTHGQIINAAFDDLKKQIDEYEQIVKSKK